MKIINEVYNPIIRTIPDDTMMFSIFPPGEIITEKFLAENYINFYSVIHPFVGDAIFRFENLINYESIREIERFFVPKDYLIPFVKDPSILISLLEDGFYINMPVSQQAISFYSCPDNIHHHMMIFGVDTDREIFLCKDFRGLSFMEFTTSFKELMRSAELYYNPGSTERDGILAYRLDKSASHEIDLSKMYVELLKLLNCKIVDKFSAYGLGAIDFFVNDIIDKPVNDRFMFRWFETANYLREATKLMELRYNIILKKCVQKKRNA